MKKALFSFSAVFLSFLLFITCNPRNTASRSVSNQRYIVDLEGYEFVVAGEHKAMWTPQQGRSDHEDAMFARIKYVEENYNCKIRFETLGPFDAYERILVNVMSGDKPCDVLMSTIWSMGAFIANNLLEPLNRFSAINLDNQYWEPAITELGAFRGDQYLCAPTFFHTFLTTQAYFYNYDMIKGLGLQDPHELFLAGDWTIGKLYDLAVAATLDMDGSSVMDINSRYGISAADTFGDYITGQFQASGLTFISEDADGRMLLSMGSERAFNVIRDIKRLFTAGVFVPQRSNDTQYVWLNQFTDGRALFFVGNLSVYDYLSRNCDFEYRILPPPKWDFSDKYYTPINHNAQVMSLIINNPDREKAVIILEALAKQGEREVEINLNEHYTVKGQIPDAVSYQYIKDISQKYLIADKASIMGGAYYSNVNIGTRGLLTEAVRFDTDISTLYERSGSRTQSLIDDFWNTRK